MSYHESRMDAGQCSLIIIQSYKIEGAHTAIVNDCAACHKGIYNGTTPKTCVGCHQVRIIMRLRIRNHTHGDRSTDCGTSVSPDGSWIIGFHLIVQQPIDGVTLGRKTSVPPAYGTINRCIAIRNTTIDWSKS